MSDEVRGRDLRQERTTAGLTQKAVADAMGVSTYVLAAVEREEVSELAPADFVARYRSALAAGAAEKQSEPAVAS